MNCGLRVAALFCCIAVAASHARSQLVVMLCKPIAFLLCMLWWLPCTPYGCRLLQRVNHVYVAPPLHPAHRSLAQLLLVLDDADLHKRQTPFTLGTSRAIASTLNSLVFHTAFTAQERRCQQQLSSSMALMPATVSYGTVRNCLVHLGS